MTFIEQLTNTYIRFNRKRLRGSTNDDDDTNSALNCLFEVLLTLSKTMSPFTPFFTEYLYQNLRKVLPNDSPASIHFCSFPTPITEAIDPAIEKAVDTMQSIILLGRTARERRKLFLKTPLRELTVVLKNTDEVESVKPLLRYIIEELNVRTINFSLDSDSFIAYVAQPRDDVLGKRLRDKAKPVKTEIAKLTHSQIKEFVKTGSIDILSQQITLDDVQIISTFTGNQQTHEAQWDDKALIVLDVQPDKQLLEEATCRNIVSRIQRLRKNSGVNINDGIEVFF